MYRNPTMAELRALQKKFPWEEKTSVKRGRGRPKGSKNKTSEDIVLPPDVMFVLGSSGRGRPKGSKNKKRGPGRPKGSKNKHKGRGRPKGALTKLPVATRRSELTKFGSRRVFRNMTHIPPGSRGRPEKEHYWILDLYDSKEKHLGTRISKFPTSKKAAEFEAIEFIGHHMNGAVVRSLTIAGPYNFKPNASTERI